MEAEKKDGGERVQEAREQHVCTGGERERERGSRVVRVRGIFFNLDR